MKQRSPQAARPREKHKGSIIWGAGVIALLLAIATMSTLSGTFAHLGDIVFDGYQRLKPRKEAGAPVVVVDIDEASLRAIGQWPWPRTTVATLVDRLGTMGAAAIAMDIVFPESDRTSPSRAIDALRKDGAKIDLPHGMRPLDNDAVLAKAFASNRVIAGLAISNETKETLPEPKTGFAFGGEDPKHYLPPFSGGVANLPILSKAAAGIGFFSFPVSKDGVIRSLPLIALADRKLYPALSVEALRVAQGAGSLIVRSTGASGEIDSGAAAMTALKDGAFSMPTGPGGQFRIYYSGMPQMKTVSAARILSGDAPAALSKQIAGHIVIVGTSAVGLRDLVVTPLQSGVPGARVHAEIIDQIMGTNFLRRPDWARGAEVICAVILGLILLLAEWRFGALASALAAVGAIIAAVALSWLAFSRWGLLIDPIIPSTAVAFTFAATMPALLLLSNRQRRFIRSAFGRYLSPALVGRLADNTADLRLGGETRELTVLFSDIRGFTSLSEKLDPDALTTLLNNVLTPVTDVLLDAEATIDKYIGDAVMAFWNAPLDIPEHRRKACLAALDMHKAVNDLNQNLDFDLKIGIGLHSGNCCVGNLGSARRFSYSAIGDTVNLASRVEGLTKQYGLDILVTEAACDGAEDLAFLEADLVRVVGRERPIRIFALVGDANCAASESFAACRSAHQAFLDAYRAGAPDEALERLGAARKAAPKGIETLHQVYADRLAAMRETPPDEAWDGVHAAERK